VASIDADALRAWSRRAADALGVGCDPIDALNVFPVADADTGSNMVLTMQAAAAAAERAGAAGGGLAAVADAMASGSLAAARGSSGVILSRYLHGIAAAFADTHAADGATLQQALTAAAEAAYAAVNEPVAGTILSVAAAAAKAAREVDPVDVPVLLKAAASAAHDELARTTEQLPALAAAGVVDAGGQGLVVVLDALVDVVTGVDDSPRPQIAPGPAVGTSATSSFAYEVQYLLAAPIDVLPALRERLGQLGHAVAVVSGADLHNVHAHVDDVGAAIEAGAALGRPSRISVHRFADQVARSTPPTATVAEPLIGPRVVALSPAGGIADMFRAAGAIVVEANIDDPGVGTALTTALCAGGVTSVVVLPNARDFKMVADEAIAHARAAGHSATVVPTRSPVQGLAALAVHDPARRAADDAVAMSAAAAATRYAEVTRSRYDALTSAGPCRAGDVLGLIDDDVAAIGDDIAAVARELLDRLLIGGGELVTIISGADVPEDLAADLADYVHATRPAVETVVQHGGQPTYPLMLGVE
jgi:hypothetical protein